MGSNCVSRPQALNARFCSSRFPAPSCARSRFLPQEPVGQPDSRPSGWRLAAIVGLRPNPGASLSPSRPWAAQRFLSATDGQEANALFSRYLLVAESFGQAQDDPCPEDIPLTARLGCHDALEFALLFRAHLDCNGGRHNPYHATTAPLCHHI